MFADEVEGFLQDGRPTRAQILCWCEIILHLIVSWDHNVQNNAAKWSLDPSIYSVQLKTWTLTAYLFQMEQASFPLASFFHSFRNLLCHTGKNMFSF